MNGDLIITLLVIAAAILALLIAKLSYFWRDFAENTRYLCYEMDHAVSYKEYRRWRGELRCHYLCLIPFVNRKNVMRLYRRIYRNGDHAKKEKRKDSLVPLLLPSIFGIFICMVCICSMTWAWYTASVQVPTQKLTAAYYEVTVESVIDSNSSKISPVNGNYELQQNTTYTVRLKASGSVKECGGYCLIQNTANKTKIYTQTFKPGESITVQFEPTVSGEYTLTGVWGSLPADTVDYLHQIDSDTVPSADEHAPDNTNIPAQSKPSDQPSEPAHGTYTVQSGDTLSGIAESFNTTVDKMAAYNGITNKGSIKSGQILNIPPQDYVIPMPTAPTEYDSAVSELPSESTQEPAPELSEESQTELVR